MAETVASAPGRVTVYSITGCPHCVQAKASLGRLGVPVWDVDMGRHPELRVKVKELTGRSTVPQIFFNSVHVGGNDQLQKLVRKDFIIIPLIPAVIRFPKHHIYQIQVVIVVSGFVNIASIDCVLKASEML